MKRLSQVDIKFIDTYLKNSEIIFTDIRIEIVDHVASEIEAIMNDGDPRDFYYIFKDYMVKNKASLLKDSRRYYKASDKKILRKLVKKAFSLTGLLVFFLTLFSFNLINEFIDNEHALPYIKNAPFAGLIGVGFIYLLFLKKKKERFSSLERITFYFMIVVQLTNIVMNSNANQESLTYLKIGSALIISLIILLLIIAFEFKKEYELKYKNVL
jgi:hypothetical protein